MARQPLPRIQRDVIGEILRQLRAAERAISAAIRGASDADRARRLYRQRAEIARVIEVFRAAAEASMHGGLDAAWQAGAAVIRAQVAAAAATTGVAIGGRLDARLLLAMRHFLTDRIADVSRQAIDKLNTVLAQHLLGVYSLSETVTQTQRILGGITRRRAMTITYTEIGRAYSASQYEQMLEQLKLQPNLKKRWIHSDKEHGRPGHILCADVTTAEPIPVAEPFEIVDLKTGAVEKLRYPRDPQAGPGQTINCGCMMAAVPPEDEEYVPLTDADLVPAGTVVRNGVVIPPPPPPPGGGAQPPGPPDDPFEALKDAVLQGMATHALASGLEGRGLLRWMWTDADSYSRHVARRLGEGVIASADEMAEHAFAVLAAAQAVSIVIPAGAWQAAAKFQITADGWIVLVGADGRIVTAYPFDPDRINFEQWNAQHGNVVRQIELSAEDRALLARLFAVR